MAYPTGVKTRMVSFGGAATVEAGTPLDIRISTVASRSLIWVAEGYRLESLAASYQSALEGDEILFEVPTTDQSGWLDAETRQAIIVEPGQASHLYTTTLDIYQSGGSKLRTYTVGPYAVPDEPGVLDGDLINPDMDPVSGTLTTFIPGPEGPKGDDGANVLPTDEAIAQAVNMGGSLSGDAVRNVAIPRHVDETDTKATVTRRLYFVDIASSNGHVLEIDHYGNGTKNAGATYGVDLQNFPGAATAVVIHQYSAAGNAVLIDNTDSGTAIRVRNTENLVINPGKYGTGKFLQFDDQGSVRFDVMADGSTWVHAQAVAARPGLTVTNRSASRAVEVDVYGTGGGMRIRNMSGSTGFMFTAGGSGAPGFALDATGVLAIIDATNVHMRAGEGDPEGAVAAPRGSIYLRTGGLGPYFYVKESGSGNTGWVGK